MRRNIEKLIEGLSKLKKRHLKDLAMTTNGFSLAKCAEKLKRAGLNRVTISLDSLKKDNFQRITGLDKLEEILAGIKAAKLANLNPVKINAVIVRGWNEDEIIGLADFARRMNLSMRFIEYMPLDSEKYWKRNSVVTGKEILARLDEVFSLKRKSNSPASATAQTFYFEDNPEAEIGIIAPISEIFCGACSRIRLTADGQIRTCLFSIKEHNLRALLRSGAKRAEIIEFIRAAVMQKERSHLIGNSDFLPASRSMSFIGG